MSKQHKLQRRMPKQLTMKQAKLLDDIEAMIDDGEWDDAEQKLLSFTRNHPDVAPGWEVFFRLATHIGDYATAYRAATNLMALEPEEETHLYNAVVATSELNMLFTPLHYAELYLKRFPGDIKAKDIQSIRGVAASEVERLQREDEMVRNAPDFEALRLHERAQMLVSSGNVAEGRKVALEAAKRLPGAPAPLNNIATSYAVEGNLNEAIKITRQVLENHPDNLVARGNLAQFLIRLGQNEEAQPLLSGLREETPKNPDHWVKILETLAFAGMDEAIIFIYERALSAYKALELEMPPFGTHLAAAAYARMGDERKARQLWQQVIKRQPGMELAQDNLEDLSLPLAERHGAWHLSSAYWLKETDVTQIYQTVRKYSGKEVSVVRQRLRTLVDNNLALKTALPIMLERCDPAGCEIALILAFILPTDLLLRFALGQRGSDSMRFNAARKLVDLGVIDGKQPLKMYVNGVQTEVLLQEIEIYTESEPSEIPKRAQDLMQAGYDAINIHNFVDALKYVDQALALAPEDRILLGHKVNALIGLRRNSEAEKLAQDLVAAHPDYFFARCLMAQFCIQKRKFDEAEDWLKPLIGRDRYHISEFRALSQLNVMLYEGRGDKQTAGVWRAMGESVLNTE